MSGPIYSLCESMFARPDAPWHLRVLTDAGRKFGGGADTPALCGRVVHWDSIVTRGANDDIDAVIRREAVCPKCAKIYLEARR